MRIYYTFLCDGELDLLEFRVKEDYRNIDVFVLVEAGQTCGESPSLASSQPKRHASPGQSAKSGHIKLLDLVGQSGVAARMASLRGEAAQSGSPYFLRYATLQGQPIPSAGRHLTAIDPAAQLVRKLPRMFHEEWATDRGLHPPHRERCQWHAVHHRGWWYAERPLGPMPDELARLAQACPFMMRTQPLPVLWQRRMVRTWSWIRLWLRLSPKACIHNRPAL